MILRVVLLGFFLSLNFQIFKLPLERESIDADRFVANASLRPDPQQTVSYGRALLRRTKDTAISIAQCGQLRGCDTGVIVEAANQEKLRKLIDKDSAGRLEDEFCTKNPDYLMCWYNLGQGFYDYTSRSIEKSAELCKNLHNKSEDAYKHCVGGVFRRWYYASDGTRSLCVNYTDYIHQCAIAVIVGRQEEESLRHVD